MKNEKIGVYPGSFDPITNGHMDIIIRSTHIVDHLVIGIAVNADKKALFTLEERSDMVKNDIKKAKSLLHSKIDVVTFEGLLMSFAAESKANMIIRGLRAVSDFDYEFQMAGMNARLEPDIETIFLMASESHQFISSRFVREICSLNGDVSSFVSENVLNKLNDKFKIS